MHQQFTDGARAIMIKAQETAAQFNHEYIGTEHILWGIIGTPNTEAFTALRQVNILGVIDIELKENIKANIPVPIALNKPPHTARAKRVLELAREYSRTRDDQCVGTEHLLIGLMREEGGIAGQVLKRHTSEETLEKALHLLRSKQYCHTHDLHFQMCVLELKRALGLPHTSDGEAIRLAIQDIYDLASLRKIISSK